MAQAQRKTNRAPRTQKPVLTREIAASIIAALNAVPPARPKVEPGDMPIPNIADLADAKLIARMRAFGVVVLDGTPRPDLIKIARDEGLWKYEGDVIPAKYKAKYGKTGNCGDNVAGLLIRPAGTDPDKHFMFLADVAEANGIDIERWSHCNIGQKTMNLGNVLRGKIKRGEYVIIGTTEWNPDAA